MKSISYVKKRRISSEVRPPHDIDEVVYLVDRVWVLDSKPGRLSADISINFLQRSPARWRSPFLPGKKSRYSQPFSACLSLLSFNFGCCEPADTPASA